MVIEVVGSVAGRAGRAGHDEISLGETARRGNTSQPARLHCRLFTLAALGPVLCGTWADRLASSTFRLIAVILPLGLDTLGVSLALGVAGFPAHRRLRLSLLFTGFEAACR